MPTYDYVCQNCGHAMEVMHSVHGHGPASCPKCGGAMKRAFSPPAVHFKGTGWARKERSSTGKPRREDRTETGASSGEGAEPSAGSTGSPRGAQPTAKDGAAKDGAAKGSD